MIWVCLKPQFPARICAEMCRHVEDKRRASGTHIIINRLKAQMHHCSDRCPLPPVPYNKVPAQHHPGITPVRLPLQPPLPRQNTHLLPHRSQATQVNPPAPPPPPPPAPFCSPRPCHIWLLALEQLTLLRVLSATSKHLSSVYTLRIRCWWSTNQRWLLPPTQSHTYNQSIGRESCGTSISAGLHCSGQ
jgi:hypothetical protein